MTIQRPVRAAFEVPGAPLPPTGRPRTAFGSSTFPSKGFSARWLGSPGRHGLSRGDVSPVPGGVHPAFRSEGSRDPCSRRLARGVVLDECRSLHSSEQPGQGNVDLNAFQWRLMLPIPPDATSSDIEAAVAQVAATKAPPAISRVRVEAVKEGQCVQMLHVGAYNAEVPTLERLHRAMAQAGLRPHGAHHEIYISDPNRTPPQRLKTVIRPPVAEAAAS